MEGDRNLITFSSHNMGGWGLWVDVHVKDGWMSRCPEVGAVQKITRDWQIMLDRVLQTALCTIQWDGLLCKSRQGLYGPHHSGKEISSSHLCMMIFNVG